MKAANKMKLIILQEEALELYLTYFHVFLPHLKMEKKDKIKIRKILDCLVKEKKGILHTLKQMEQQ